MPAKTLKLGGYGEIMINPINIKEKEYEVVDPTGKPLSRKTIGARARSVYMTADDVEVPGNQVCKKINIEGEDIVVPKFMPTSEVVREDIEEIDDNGLIYSAIERKFYNAVTDNKKIKDLILKQHKTLKFPFTAGLGWKMWNGVLTRWNDKLILVACIGDLRKELEKYDEDTIELELEVIPQTKSMKKLVKAMLAE